MSSTRSIRPHYRSFDPLHSLPLSGPERALLLALLWGEPLAQAAQRLGLSLGEASRVLSHVQKRAGVASRQALIARAVAHCWAV